MNLTEFIAGVKERLSRATPGPWEWGISALCRSRNHHKMNTNSWEKTEGLKIHWDGGVLVADKELIAHAPSDLSTAVQIIEVMRQTLLTFGTYREGQVVACGDERLYLIGQDAREVLAKADEIAGKR